MHVALLTNTAWLDEELSLFGRMIVGLMDEGVRVAQVVPEKANIAASVFGDQIGWLESRVGLLNRRRLSRLANPLEQLGVNLVHALDGRLWMGAAALADAMTVPAIFTAGSMHDIHLVEPLARMIPAERSAFIASTEPLGRAVREKLPPDYLLQTIAPGVHPAEHAAPMRETETTCFVISGNGKLDEHYEALLAGCQLLLKQHPETQFFFDGQGSDQHSIWKHASKLDILGNISLIPRRLGHREILLRADVLIHPQPLGRSRGLTLQAFGQGVPTIAVQDPWLDYLIDGETAWIVREPDPGHWLAALDRATTSPSDCHQLGAAAHRWVRANRVASEQIGEVLGVYGRLHGQTLPFPGGKDEKPKN